MRRMTALVLALVALVAGCGGADAPTAADVPATPDAADPATPNAADPATPAGGDGPAGPFETVPTVDGGELDGATLAGRDVALWFWAPWCPTCNREAQELEAALDAADVDVTVIGVAGRDGTGAMREFVERHDLTSLTHVADSDGAVWQRYGIVGQPAWVFIDGDDQTMERVLGALGPAELERRLTELAAG